MNKRLTGIISRIAVILFTIIAGVGIYLFNAQTIAGNPMPMPFGVGAAVVLSGSMEPEFSAGDLIVFVEADDYAINDIVVYQSAKNA